MFVIFFFIVVWISSIEPTLTYYLPKEFASVISLLDESFVVITFIASFNLKNRQSNKIYIAILLYVIIGFISGFIKNVPFNVQLEGSFLPIKGPLLFVSISNLKISKRMIVSFFKKLEFLFYVIFVFSVIDILSFGYLKSLLHLRIVDRGGYKMLNSFFKQPSDLAEFSFIAAFYFFKIKKSRTWFYLYSAMGFLSLNVKEIVGNILSFILNRKSLDIGKILRPKRLIILAITFTSLFYTYKNVFPDHYDVYFSQDQDGIARSVLYVTSFDIAQNDFPFGEGFGRYGSYVSLKYYSPTYSEYHLDAINGFSLDSEEIYLEDTFWPMVLGETGVVGLILYSYILYLIFKPFLAKRIYKSNYIVYGRYLIYFAIICSLAKPFFCQPPAYLWFFGLLSIILHLDKYRSSISGKTSDVSEAQPSEVADYS